MNQIFSADWILPVVGEPILDGAVEVDTLGLIVNIFKDRQSIPVGRSIQYHKGIIVPGFVNAHCHLELSHMKGQIVQGLGLTSFIQEVMRSRQASERLREEAMLQADKEMYDNGIVAVGDHVNTDHSVAVKRNSSIYYHTFIELLGFDPNKAQEVFQKASTLQQSWLGSSSITPHAPYSVSRDLMKLLKKQKGDTSELLSIHNQETEEENKFFRYKTGKFLNFYQNIGQTITSFKAQAKSSLQTYLPLLSRQQPLMLVHNTFTSPKDIYFAERINRDITWCFCPKANLYIEGQLPKIHHFQQSTGRIALGTDSLASNDSLCILSELKILHRHDPTLKLSETISWATLNGASHLQIDQQYGSIEVGKRPGLNLLENVNGMQLTAQTQVRKLC
jgi:cytosine/adenosine deaminase-related metal-dependent hydrolase